VFRPPTALSGIVTPTNVCRRNGYRLVMANYLRPLNACLQML